MNRSLNRLPITSAITQLLRLPSLFQLYNKSTNFILPLIRRFLAKSIRFMDSLFFSHEGDDIFSTSFDHSFFPSSFSDPGESLFLVPFSWWTEAVSDGGGVVDGMSEAGGVLYNATAFVNGAGKDDYGDEEGFGDSEILVRMRREGEAGSSGDEWISGWEGDLALVSEWMFFTALKRHFHKEGLSGLLPVEISAYDLFSLRIRLLYMREECQLVIKISQKDHDDVSFNKAYSVFCTKSGMMQVWDFSGQTNQFFLNDSKFLMHSGESNVEIPLELQIYGLPYPSNGEESRKEEMTMEMSRIDGPSPSSSVNWNGYVENVNLFPKVTPSLSGSYGTGALGLTGLCNLGNTCFMNSAVQCLVHTPNLVDYFLGHFRKDLNFENPLGSKGKLAIAFGDLLRKLWAPGSTPVTPRMFKSTISSFTPQFSGYNQHDSQEFLSFLLDGLHEDLNRVKRKPYVQAKDEDGRPDEEVADEYWGNHLSRNDSIIVDLCQGQYRSTLVCPVCKKLSITFDPFMYLSLPLPSSALRKMTLTVLSTDGTSMPHPVTVTVPNNGTFNDLVGALGIACSLKENETLLIAEIYNNSIIQTMVDVDLVDSIDLIRDDDKLVAYRLPKDKDGSPLVEFIHQQEKSCFLSDPSFKTFGIPLVARLSDFSKGSAIRKEFLKLIHPFLLSGEELFNDVALEKSVHEDKKMEDTVFDEATNSNIDSENDLDADDDFGFYLDKSKVKIQMDEPVPISNTKQPIKVFVSWSEKMILDYDTAILSLLPEVCKITLTPELTQESISLYNCVDAFVKEEPLGPDDMWYCPNCQEHRQANKKLDLWRLPEILVIHLKRFSYTRFLKNKLESFVDFPTDDFDLSKFIIQKNNMVSNRYMLYAVSNHYGGMVGGHYTAFVKHSLSKWYEFDDSHVFPVTEEQIKTQAAYVLFYKRI